MNGVQNAISIRKELVAKLSLLAACSAMTALASAQYVPYRVRFDFNNPWVGSIAPSFADRTYGGTPNQLAGPASLALMTPESGAMRLSSSTSSPLLSPTFNTKIAGVRALLFNDNPGNFVLSTYFPFIGGPMLAPYVTVSPFFDVEERRLYEQAMQKQYSPYYEADVNLESGNLTWTYLWGNGPSSPVNQQLGIAINRIPLGFGSVDAYQSGVWTNIGSVNPGWNRLRVQLLPDGLLRFSINGVVLFTSVQTFNVLSNPVSGSLTLEVRHPITLPGDTGSALFDNFVYGSSYMAGKIDQGSAPIDLNGVYTAPSSDSAWAATGNRLASGQVKASSQGTAAEEATFTPFSDASKAPRTAQLTTFVGQSASFNVNLAPTAAAVWAPADSFKISAESTSSSDSASVSVSVSGGTKTFTIAGLGTGTIVDTTDATQYRVLISESGSMLNVTVTRLNGTEAESSLTSSVPVATLSNVIFVSEITGGANSLAAAAVSGFKVSQPRNFVALEVADPYAQTGEAIAYDLTYGNLDQTIGGVQAFLTATGNQSGPLNNILPTRSYNPVPFAQGINRPNPLHLASGVGAPAPLVRSSGTAGTVTLTAGAAEGSVSSGIAVDDGAVLNPLPTLFYDSDGGEVTPVRIGSPTVLVDNTIPEPVTLSATQGLNNVLVAPGVQTGLLNLSVAATDVLSGLVGRPQITLDFFPIGIGGGDVTLNTSSAIGNNFKASYNVPANVSNGAGQIIVSAVDKAGNQRTQAFPINVNTATLTLNLQLQGFASGGPSVTRGIEIAFGGTDGGGNLVLPLNRDVQFSASGAATVVFNSSHGLPNAFGANPYKVSVKDPAHTLRRTVVVGGTGNQYTASAQLEGGNLNRDNRVDIGDYVVYATRFGTPVNANTPFPQLATFRHADSSGDGAVGSEEFSYISANFGLFDDVLVGNYGREDRTIRTRITVAQAMIESGSRRVAEMDLNRDGVITLDEVQRYISRLR